MKVKIIGRLWFSDDGGLRYSLSLVTPPTTSPSILAASRLAGLSDTAGDLKAGDYVVHTDHGVAKLLGLKKQGAGATQQDFLELEFAEGTRVFVPAERADLLSKREPGGSPQLAKFGAGNPAATTYRLEVLPGAYEWPGIAALPELPRNIEDLAIWNEWKNKCHSYMRALHADERYRLAAKGFFERQRREPQPLPAGRWAYRHLVLSVESSGSEQLRDDEREVVFIKHFVLRQERQFDRVKREVEALENFEKLSGSPREPIPENVRLFVWQRDQGRCVKCGLRERLEFDHIIPVASGGSSTERNVQLLCESSNRSKGAAI